MPCLRSGPLIFPPFSKILNQVKRAKRKNPLEYSITVNRGLPLAPTPVTPLGMDKFIVLRRLLKS